MAFKVQVDIDTKTFVRFWLVVIAFALLALFIYYARTPLLIILISLFLAVALTPPVNRLASWMPGRSRIAGTAIAYIIVVAILSGFVFLVIPPIIQQSSKFIQTVPELVEGATDESSKFSELVQKYNLQPQVDDAVQSIKDNAAGWAKNIGSVLFVGVGSFLRTVIGILITLVMTFFMLIEGPRWLDRLWGVYINKNRMRHHRNVAQKMYTVVTSYVSGQLLVALIAGVLAALATLVIAHFFDIPANLALPVGAVTAICGLIPMFGATIGGILAGILLAFSSFGAAIAFVIYLIIYQQIEGNLITTYIQAKTLDLSPLAVLVAVTLGTYVFGLIGGLISIPILGIIQVLIRELLKNRRVEKVEKRSAIRSVINKIQPKA